MFFSGLSALSGKKLKDANQVQFFEDYMYFYLF